MNLCSYCAFHNARVVGVLTRYESMPYQYDHVIGRQESISAGQHKFEFSRACFARDSQLEAVPCFVAVIVCTSLIL